jgi:AhpD family alkylhydroperoxidase
MSNAPKAYRQFGERHPEILRAYENLKEACKRGGPLDRKTAELVQLGIAIGARLEGAVHAHARLAREAGAGDDEIRHVAILATTTLGFSSMMRSLAWVDDVLGKSG